MTDPMDGFETPDEILAYVFAQLGPEALSQVLELAIGGVEDMRGVDREFWRKLPVNCRRLG
jgi:hypothetical protein